MRRGLGLLAAMLMAALAMPAYAATIILTGSSTASGTDLVYSNGSGANKVWMSATGVTFNTSFTTITTSTPIKYQDGLGVNPQGDNRHTIDNSGAFDFIVLRFDKSVILNGASLQNDYDWYRDNPLDTDATISFAPAHWANLGQTYSTDLTGAAKNHFFNTLGGTLWANDFQSDTSISGDRNATFNTGVNAKASNVWIIGASIKNKDQVDSFKLRSVSYILPPPPGGVPEPSTWAMLILGMGAVGGAMRRRKARESLALA